MSAAFALPGSTSAAEEVAAMEVPAYPGQPGPGTVRWGASVGLWGMEPRPDDPTDPYERHEQYTDNPIGVHRKFFSLPDDWQSGGYYDIESWLDKDGTHGRLSWMSFKLADWTWAEVAAGAADDHIDPLLTAMDAATQPVWLTIHHEPENDTDTEGTAGDWRAMQAHVRDRMDALGVTNIAFAPIVMTWTFNPNSGRDPEDWWVDGIFDFSGVDHYAGHTVQPLPTDPWYDARAFAESKGVDIAVGEWATATGHGQGYWDAPADAYMQAWYDHAIASGFDGQGARVTALAVFDTELSNGMHYALHDPSLALFRVLMDAPTSVHSGNPDPGPTPTPSPSPTETEKPKPDFCERKPDHHRC